MRQFEAPDALRDGPREGALLVAEHLAFQQPRGNGGAVELDESALPPRAQVVDGPRHQLLAGPGLAVDQHRGIGGRHRLHLLEDGLQRAALPDDFLEAIVRADFVFQIDLFLRQARIQLFDALVGHRILQRDRHLAGRLREELQIVRREEALLPRAQIQRSQCLAMRHRAAGSRATCKPSRTKISPACGGNRARLFEAENPRLPRAKYVSSQ